MNGRYYNVTVTGNVQDIGFRGFIESTANSYHVRGYVFNDPDGSVKMLCGGSVESLDEFFHAIETRVPSGITISPTSCDLDIGGSQTFTAVCNDTTGAVMDCPTLTWNSGGMAVGTITSAGVFTASAVGTTNITASAEDVTSNATTVNVVTAPSPCYIATATYGTPLDRRIDILRDFRDEVLMTNPIGEAFVSTYYRTSPPIADALRGNDGLRTITRSTLIDPLVSLSKFALNGILLVFIIGLTTVLSFRKDRAKILRPLLVGAGSILLFTAVIFSLGFIGYAIPFCATIGAYMLPFVIPLSVIFTVYTVLKMHVPVSDNIRKYA